MVAESKGDGSRISRRRLVFGIAAGVLLATNMGVLVMGPFGKRVPEVVAHAYVPPKFNGLPEPSPRKMESLEISLRGPFVLDRPFSEVASLDSWIDISNLGIAYSSLDKRNHLVGWVSRTGEEVMGSEEGKRQVRVVIKAVTKDGKTSTLSDEVFLNPRTTVNLMGWMSSSGSIDATLPEKLAEVERLTIHIAEEERKP
jgi:hypothetical protein